MTRTSAPHPHRLAEIFLDLTAIPSPSLCERGMADRLRWYLERWELEVHEDSAGSEIGGDTGNLYVLVPGADGSQEPVLALGAHMDTVQPETQIEPVLSQGVFRNRLPAILGADNKVAVTALVYAVEMLMEQPDRPCFELFFSVAEELGVLGIRFMDLGWIKSPLAAVFDSAGPVGGIIVRAPSQQGVQAVFRGRAAHAGLEPEQGRSAIKAAAGAIAGMQLGRIDHQTTANIGVIEGGSAANIIPDRCRLEGQARSHDDDRLSETLQDMVAVMQSAAAQDGVDVEIDLTEEYRSFALDRTSPVVILAERAIEDTGLSAEFLSSGGGSDANFLNAGGIPAVNLDCGMSAVHTQDEHVSLAALEAITGVIMAMVRRAEQPDKEPFPNDCS